MDLNVREQQEFTDQFKAKDSNSQAEKNSFNRPQLTNPIILGEITMASPFTQTTVGAAGGASALPATPTGYLKFIIGNTEYVLPYYAVA